MNAEEAGFVIFIWAMDLALLCGLLCAWIELCCSNCLRKKKDEAPILSGESV
jgi:hypothetical protein